MGEYLGDVSFLMSPNWSYLTHQRSILGDESDLKGDIGVTFDSPSPVVRRTKERPARRRSHKQRDTGHDTPTLCYNYHAYIMHYIMII